MVVLAWVMLQWTFLWAWIPFVPSRNLETWLQWHIAYSCLSLPASLHLGDVWESHSRLLNDPWMHCPSRKRYHGYRLGSHFLHWLEDSYHTWLEYVTCWYYSHGEYATLKNLYGVTIVRILHDSACRGINKYPMLRSVTDAKTNPPISCMISSTVRSGYSLHLKHWLIWQKSITSLMVPFFLGIPTACEAHLCFLIYSVDNLWSAQILHWWFNFCLKTSLFFNGTGYGLAQISLAPSQYIIFVTVVILVPAK